MSKGLQVKRSTYKSKGPQVKRSTSQKVPSQKVHSQKVYKNLMIEIKAYKKPIPHLPVVFQPSLHNLRDILLKLLHFIDNFYFSNLSFQIL